MNKVVQINLIHLQESGWMFFKLKSIIVILYQLQKLRKT